MADILCVICQHRTVQSGQVCQPDRKRITEQLSDLSRKLGALPLQLVPSGGVSLSERVATSRTGSPTGARLDVLTLVGPGGDGLSRAAAAGMLHPHVRRWQTTETVTVTVTAGAESREEEREIVVWHQELVRDADGQPAQILHDDQIGLLPPFEWLDSWARTWRKHFGHHGRPTRTGRGGPKTAGAAMSAVLAGEEVMSRQHAANVILGLRGRLPLNERPEDPLAEEWQIRFGDPLQRAPHTHDIAYLLTWLDEACEQDVGIAGFAAELGALTAELTRVLGERPDQQWLGRCPAMLTDRLSGTSRPCGAGLWQDPWASQVACPRCRSTWGPERIALLHLAVSIRSTWPVDRRRRYTSEEIDGLGEMRGLRCPACGSTTVITWREVTAAGDRHRSWRPERATCPGGCPEAERLI